MTDRRNYGIDLLRVVSMLCIVGFHYLDHGHLILMVNQNSVAKSILYFLLCIAMLGVDCFAIISGYVGYGKSTLDCKRWRNFIFHWIEAVIYGLLACGLFTITDFGDVGVQNYLDAIHPLSGRVYWYLSSYFFVVLAMPSINYMVSMLNSKDIAATLIGGLATLYFTHFFEGVFSIALLLYLYFIGAILKKHELPHHVSKRRCMLFLACSLLFVWGWYLLFGVILNYKEQIGKLWYRNDSPFLLLSATILVMLFSTLRIKKWVKKILGYIVPSIFSVYLINDNPLVREYIIGNTFPKSFHWSVLIGYFFVSTIVFFVISILIDIVLRKLLAFFLFDRIIERIVEMFLNIAAMVQKVTLTCLLFQKRNK